MCKRIFLLIALPLAASQYCNAEEIDFAAQLNAAAQKTAGTTFELKYKFHPNERVQYKVEHLVTVETTIEDNRQRARSRSVSTKQWDFDDVKADGLATFEHQVAYADMWQQTLIYVTDEEGRQASKEREIRYNSHCDPVAPLHYQKVAESIAVPLAKVVIDSSGKLVKREDEINGGTWGGQLVVPLPPQAVGIGHTWHKPQEIVVRMKDGRVKRIKTRQQYKLQSVDEGIATIAFDTQILSPGIRDQPKVMVQIVQKLTEGTIEFDIAAGRVIRQQLKLDETVIGFNGAKSIMNYSGRFNEELIVAEDEIAQAAAK